MTPVITIDGPSGSGKGTIAQKIAKKLGWHYLDSGAIYRAVGWKVLQSGIDPNNHDALRNLINNVKIEMQPDDIWHEAKIFCNNQEVTSDIRSEACGQMASITSAIPFVREAMLARQRDMRQEPGLVTDGRDMGTIVFPEATIKFFFLASVEERAKRRYNQLINKGQHANLRDIRDELHVRDERDANRSIAPTKPAADAILIDTTHLDVNGVVEVVWQHVQRILGKEGV
ncbi:MAG: (d)CMP kinase [Coxiellaceae bacterium]|nr:(d)CMP kinase [Coxiellaceae bacterium]